MSCDRSMMFETRPCEWCGGGGVAGGEAEGDSCEYCHGTGLQVKTFEEGSSIQ